MPFCITLYIHVYITILNVLILKGEEILIQAVIFFSDIPTDQSGDPQSENTPPWGPLTNEQLESNYVG